MHVVATAGHVDHGKTTLVRAVTGMDPDRLSEEKSRGLTVDLGFAWTTLPSGRQFAFVDVPGHIRFIKNMLAGVGAVNACVFVVAATEGWKAQSEEHLRILDLLGVQRGIVALTKIGLVDHEGLERAHADLASHITGTFLENAEIVEVDVLERMGQTEFIKALEDLLSSTPTAVDHDRPRLWIDRSFTVRGTGTIVTGTLAGGHLAAHELVEGVPVLSPGRTPPLLRVRGLETHKKALTSAPPGQRIAVNLLGVAHTELVRGQALIRPGQWALTKMIDASLEVLASLDHEVGRRGAYLAYVGSSQHSVALRILGPTSLSPGEVGTVRIHFPVHLPLLPGDHYVLRESGRSETVGGGEVLDVEPVLSAAAARPDRSVDRIVAERGWLLPEQLQRLTGVRREPNVGRWIVNQQLLAQTQERIREAICDAGPFGLDKARLSERDRAVISTLDGVITRDSRVKYQSAADSDGQAHRRYLALLEHSPFAPPDPKRAGVTKEELRELVGSGQVIEHNGYYFSARSMAMAAQIVARLLSEFPRGVTASAIREELGTTRRYLLPILGHLDATGVTRRRGDVRIGGPRLPVEPL